MKKITSLLLAFAMLLSMAALTVSAETPKSGLTFTADDNYETTVVLSAAPRTIEAWVKVDADASNERLGIIVGNYVSGSYDSTKFGLEIRKNGNPYLY